MAFFWKEEYNTNIHTIDQQHQMLFELGSKLYYAKSFDDHIDHYDEIIAALSELKKYAIRHFGYEESLMKKYQYKNYISHKNEHDTFINKILEIEKEDIDEKQQKISMELIVFIADWITNHILKTDHQYKSFFNEKGVD